MKRETHSQIPIGRGNNSTKENRTLAKIFDEIAVEDTQSLIKKDLLLKTDYAKESEN